MIPLYFNLSEINTLEDLLEEYLIHEYQTDSDKYGPEPPNLYTTDKPTAPSVIPALAHSRPVKLTEGSATQVYLETVIKIVSNTEASEENSEKIRERLSEFSDVEMSDALKQLVTQGTLVRLRGGGQKSFHFGDK